jgi:hypothetical protein
MTGNIGLVFAAAMSVFMALESGWEYFNGASNAPIEQIEGAR